MGLNYSLIQINKGFYQTSYKMKGSITNAI